MGYYTYKNVFHREDFIKVRERMVANGFEDDGDPNYDGSYWSIASELLDEKDREIEELRARRSTPPRPEPGREDELARLTTLRPRDEWHEDDGHVLWWHLPIAEPPCVGSPLSDDFDEDFPEDYYTHWSPIPNVVEPAAKGEGGDGPGHA